MEYHKIQTIFKRDPETNLKTLLEGQWSIPEFEYLADSQWEFTEKVDGTNVRIYLKNDQIRIEGRKDLKSVLPDFLYSRLEDKFEELLPQMMECFKLNPDEEVCIYGEGYGNRIQKVGKRYNPDDVDFVLFDIRVGKWWLRREDIENIAVTLGIDIVPIIGAGDLYDLIRIVRNGLKSTWGDFEAEGIVARPTTELFTRSGHRIITKLKARDFRKPH